MPEPVLPYYLPFYHRIEKMIIPIKKVRRIGLGEVISIFSIIITVLTSIVFYRLNDLERGVRWQYYTREINTRNIPNTMILTSGDSLETITLLELSMLNVGEETVRASDYASNVQVRLPYGTRIYSADPCIRFLFECGLNARISGRELIVAPIDLGRGEGYTITMVVSHLSGPIEVYQRIRNIPNSVPMIAEPLVDSSEDLVIMYPNNIITVIQGWLHVATMIIGILIHMYLVYLFFVKKIAIPFTKLGILFYICFIIISGNLSCNSLIGLIHFYNDSHSSFNQYWFVAIFHIAIYLTFVYPAYISPRLRASIINMN